SRCPLRSAVPSAISVPAFASSDCASTAAAASISERDDRRSPSEIAFISTLIVRLRIAKAAITSTSVNPASSSRGLLRLADVVLMAPEPVSRPAGEPVDADFCCPAVHLEPHVSAGRRAVGEKLKASLERLVAYGRRERNLRGNPGLEGPARKGRRLERPA